MSLMTAKKIFPVLFPWFRNGKNIRVGGLISGKTGENNPLFVGLFITSILSLIAGAGVYIAVKNKKEEQ